MVALRNYFGEPREGQRVHAVPGEGMKVPLWILGSSIYGASLAAALGLPYAFASHFAPAMMEQAIEVYRSRFEPSEQLEEPYLMLGFNVCAADTDAEAQYLRSSALQAVVALRKGTPGRLPPPLEGFEEQLDPHDRAMVAQFTQCSAVGSPEAVKRGVLDFIERTGADELMLVGQMYDHNARLHCFEIVAELNG